MIGGWAHNRYAEPRFTGDLDIFVNNSIENQKKLRIVLEKFGYGSALPNESEALFRKGIIMLGRPPSRIDLLIAIDGISFEQAWGNREQDLLDGTPVFFMALNDLIQNKEASGRDKDLADLKLLKRLKNKKV